jgi:hypothetical protein
VNVNIKGWSIDHTKLPDWESKKRSNLKEYLFESSRADLACFIYSEVSGHGELPGSCAIYENKEAPELLLAIRMLGFLPYAFFSEDGNLIFLKAFMRYSIRFVLVINLAERSFAIIHYSPSNWNYQIVEKGEGFFEFCFEEVEISKNPFLESYNHKEIDCAKLKFKSWNALSDGGDLNVQGRGPRYFFADKKRLFNESLEKFKLGGMSDQFFVDINRDMKLYYINVFKVDRYGHTKMLALENTDFGGKYFPVFTTLSGCIEFMKKYDIKSPIYRSRMKKIMKIMDRGYPLHSLGVVIDPFGFSISLPAGLRVTPKCLRY